MPAESPSAAPTVRLAIAGVLIVLLGVGVVFSRKGPAASATAGSTEPVTPVAGSLAMANIEARADMCSGRNLKGTGARMEVFATADTSQAPVQAGLVPMLDLNVTPKAALEAGQTVRWTGWIKAHGKGTHRFALPAGVQGSLEVSHTVVVNSATGRTDTAGSEMLEDRFYPFTLVVTVDKAALDAGMWLLAWTPPGRDAEPVMRGSLFPPTQSVATPTVASAVPAAAARNGH